jgi:hypothetical protein
MGRQITALVSTYVTEQSCESDNAVQIPAQDWLDFGDDGFDVDYDPVIDGYVSMRYPKRMPDSFDSIWHPRFCPGTPVAFTQYHVVSRTIQTQVFSTLHVDHGQGRIDPNHIS